MFAEQFVNGLVLGSTYALIAVGYALQLSILRIFNLAHGEIMMASTYVAYLVLVHTELGIGAALVAAVLAGAFFGILLERCALRFLREGGELGPLIVTIGVGTLLQAVFSLIFGFEQRAFPSPDRSAQIDFGFAQVTITQIAILGVTLLTMVLLRLLVMRTRFGRAVRATAEREQIAAAFGVNVPLVKLGTVALSSGLGALAGVLIALNFGVVSPYIGIVYGLKGLVVIIIGGAASIEGAVLGGLLLGLIEVMSAAYFLSEYRDAISYFVLIVVLAIRPGGLMTRVALR